MLQSVRGLPVAFSLLATVLVCVSAHAQIFSASGTIA